MSGPVALNALQTATGFLPRGAIWNLNPVDVCDLRKLTPDMLADRGFRRSNAEAASTALFQGDLEFLGACLGLTLRNVRWAPRLSA